MRSDFYNELLYYIDVVMFHLRSSDPSRSLLSSFPSFSLRENHYISLADNILWFKTNNSVEIV